MTSDQLVNAMQGTFSYADPGCTSFFNLFCKKKIRKLEFNDTVFLSFVSIERRCGMPTRAVDGGGHVLFAKYNFNLSYICE